MDSLTTTHASSTLLAQRVLCSARTTNRPWTRSSRPSAGSNWRATPSWSSGGWTPQELRSSAFVARAYGIQMEERNILFFWICWFFWFVPMILEMPRLARNFLGWDFRCRGERAWGKGGAIAPLERTDQSQRELPGEPGHFQDHWNKPKKYKSNKN